MSRPVDGVAARAEVVAASRHGERVIPIEDFVVDYFTNSLQAGEMVTAVRIPRGDAGTVAGHIEQLRENAPESVASYVELARLTADRAITAGLLKPEDAARLLDVLRR